MHTDEFPLIDGPSIRNQTKLPENETEWEELIGCLAEYQDPTNPEHVTFLIQYWMNYASLYALGVRKASPKHMAFLKKLEREIARVIWEGKLDWQNFMREKLCNAVATLRCAAEYRGLNSVKIEDATQVLMDWTDANAHIALTEFDGRRIKETVLEEYLWQSWDVHSIVDMKLPPENMTKLREGINELDRLDAKVTVEKIKPFTSEQDHSSRGKQAVEDEPTVASGSTVLRPLIKQKIVTLCDRLKGEKIKPWIWFESRGVNITMFNGKPYICPKTLAYDGSVTLMFWSLVDLFLQDAIVKTLDETLEICNARGYAPEAYIRETASLLDSSLIWPIYVAMADMDRKLRHKRNRNAKRRDITDKAGKMAAYLRKCRDEILEGLQAERDESSATVKDRFQFADGQVFFDGKDLELPTGLPIEVLNKLHNSFGQTVIHSELHNQSTISEASDELRSSVAAIRKAFKDHSVPVKIANKRAEGYVLQQE